MCLLINSRDDTYVAVIDNTDNKIVAMFSHHGCEGFMLSHDKEFIVTYSQLGLVFMLSHDKEFIVTYSQLGLVFMLSHDKEFIVTYSQLGLVFMLSHDKEFIVTYS